MVCVLCIIFITLIVVKSSNLPQIDNPIIKCSNIEIPAVKTDFLYSDFLKRKYNFHTDASKELMNIKPVIVQPNEELKIIFNQKPIHYMLVRQLSDGNYEKVFESGESVNNTSTISAPCKSGKYVFSISANYTEGLGIYYFSVEIAEK